MNMSQTLAFKKSSMVECSTPILCCYVNVTNKLQIIRITNIPNLHLERVVFPGERLMFEAVPEAQLEIQSNQTLSVVVLCHQLTVTETGTLNQIIKS
jgi:hypothetical protein